MGKIVSRVGIAACVFACVCGFRVSAASGQVVDPERKPIKGADACYVLQQGQGVCIKTDERGYYKLAPSHIIRVRIFREDFVPQIVSAANHISPVVLERAATLHVRVVDAESGEGVPESEVVVQYSSGVRKGPVPANVFGVILRTMTPGQVVVGASAAGYRENQISAELAGGKETMAMIHLERDPASPATTPETDKP